LNSSVQLLDYRLGDFLVKIGACTDKEVARGLRVAAYTNLPLGKTLVMLDYAPEYLIRAIVEAQSMLRDRLLQLQQAKAAVDIVKRKQWAFSDALISLGVDASNTKGTRLGELLRDADRVDSAQLDLGLTVCDYSGLPLGQVLVLLNTITDDNVRITLALQRELRSAHLERKDVIERIKTDKSADATATGLAPLLPQQIKLGELLVCASILSSQQVEALVLESQEKNKMVGQLLVEANWISQDVLTAALRLQSMLWSNKISLSQASTVLGEAHKLSSSPQMLMERQGVLPSKGERDVSFYEFLRITGYLNKEKMKATIENMMTEPRLLAMVMKYAKDSSKNKVREATKVAVEDTSTLRYLINETHPKDQHLVDSALIMHQFVQEGKLTLCQALVNFSIKSNGIENGTTQLN
jgi:hypothetical protein